MTTSEAQTGPALRNDNLTIESHLRQLNESDFLNLYKEITKSIRSMNYKENLKKLKTLYLMWMEYSLMDQLSWIQMEMN